jgi:endonuclease-3
LAPRIGIVKEYKDGNKIEKQLMEVLPKEIWGEVGMALSFLGRETCRPTNPKHSECVVSEHCEYCKMHS